MRTAVQFLGRNVIVDLEPCLGRVQSQITRLDLKDQLQLTSAATTAALQEQREAAARLLYAGLTGCRAAVEGLGFRQCHQPQSSSNGYNRIRKRYALGSLQSSVFNISCIPSVICTCHVQY